MKLHFNQLNFFQMDGGRLYGQVDESIKISKAIVDSYRGNRDLISADEGLVLCVLLNNGDCLTYDRDSQPGVSQNMAEFLRSM